MALTKEQILTLTCLKEVDGSEHSDCKRPTGGKGLNQRS